MSKSGEVIKKRLHFGVVLPSLDNTHKYILLEGINEFAKKNDIHLTAYFGTYEKDNYDYASHYEPCFEAINNSTTLNGVILYSGFIAHNVGTELYVKSVQSITRHIPVISIGMPIDGVYSVMVDNAAGMYSAVDHLIKEHGKKRIALIKGPDGHPEADARLAGYKQALADNGIPLDENLLLPGSFTPMSGRDATNELLDNRKVPFDAISCCDDEAAFGAMKILKQRGYQVPEDISVTGFDDVEEAANHKPALSTVHQDFSELGTIAADLLLNIIGGNTVEVENYVTPSFVTRRSCGCDEKRRAAGKQAHVSSKEDELRRQRVMGNIVLKFKLNELSAFAHNSFPKISINTVLVGLYHNPIPGGSSDGDRTIGTLFGFDREDSIHINNDGENPHLFSDYSLIDGFDFDRERHTMFFLPLFFETEESGVALIAYDSENPVDSYEILRMNISAAVKGASLLEKIETLSITDELTGLFNRRGFFQYVHSRILYLQRAREMVPIVLAMDMDGLKFVNDTYGHAEGDVAISTYAKLLKQVFREEDIIGRLGGDEFAVFSLIKSEDNIEKLEGRFRAKIEEYNAQGHHPYRIDGCIGAVVLSAPTKESFDLAMLSADDVLYKEKAKKKAKGLSRQ